MAKLRKTKKEIELKSIFIDQLELPPRTYNCLKRYNIHTLFDLLNKSQEDLMKMEYFRIEDVKKILDRLEIEKAFHRPFSEELIGNRLFLFYKKNMKWDIISILA
mgnify:CR=1 FL=1